MPTPVSRFVPPWLLYAIVAVTCWGFVSGLIAAAGNIAFYLALENGADTSIAIPLTNIYPLVTIGIAYLWFGERLNWIQCSNILLAVIAIILLSGEARNLGDPVAVVKRIGLTPWMIYSFVAMSKETVVDHRSTEVRNTVGESMT